MADAASVSSSSGATSAATHQHYCWLPRQSADDVTKTFFKHPKHIHISTLAAFTQNPLQPINRGISASPDRPKAPTFITRSSSENGYGGYGDRFDKPREECGVVGIFGDSEASRLCYLALHALQHRGQEGAGIVSVENKVLHSVTGLGLVSEVFTPSKLDQLPGSSAIGHVGYSTSGSSLLKNVQPFVAVGVAHNRNLVNYKSLREELEESGSIFNTSSDTEVDAKSKARPFFIRIIEACERLRGAYSLVFLTEDKLVAVRDPHGFRPLVMGRRSSGAYVFASETCALDLIEATYVREVDPGEVVVIDKDGEHNLCLMVQPQPKQCVFEHIYFALPNSFVFGKSVYESRSKYGEIHRITNANKRWKS